VLGAEVARADERIVDDDAVVQPTSDRERPRLDAVARDQASARVEHLDPVYGAHAIAPTYRLTTRRNVSTPTPESASVLAAPRRRSPSVATRRTASNRPGSRR